MYLYMYIHISILCIMCIFVTSCSSPCFAMPTSWARVTPSWASPEVWSAAGGWRLQSWTVWSCRFFLEAALAILWWYHGDMMIMMVILWWCYGCCGDIMILWWYNGDIMVILWWYYYGDTVDGCEIGITGWWMEGLSHYLWGANHPQGLKDFATIHSRSNYCKPWHISGTLLSNKPIL